MAFALTGMILFGLFMGSLPLSDPRRDGFMVAHLSSGVLVLVLTGIRLRWRLEGRMPALPKVYRDWEKRLARMVHAAFYGLMLALPLLGLMVWLLDPFVFGPGLAGQSIALANLNGWLHWCHYLGAWMLLLLLGVHVAGAIRGSFSRDPERKVLRRMTGAESGAQSSRPVPPQGTSRKKGGKGLRSRQRR